MKTKNLVISILTLFGLFGGTALFQAPPAQAGVVGDRIGSSQTLRSGDRLESPNGQYHFVMQGDGNAVAYGPRGALWWSDTFASDSVLTVQTDGNVVVLAPGSRPRWDAGTSGTNSVLVMQDDGNLVVYRDAATASWTSRNGLVIDGRDRMLPGQHLQQGERLQSALGNYQLVFSAGGDLVVYGPHQPVWSAGSAGATSLRMQSDGNLVAYSAGRAVWNTGTSGKAGAFAVMQDDGNLVLYSADGRALWDSVTASK